MSTDFVKVRHLLFRASFGIAPNEMNFIQGKSISDIIPQLLSSNYKPLASVKKEDMALFKRGTRIATMSSEQRKRRSRLRFDLHQKWVDSMANSIMNGSPFLERMSLFWHGHFACQTKDYAQLIQYLEGIRKHSLGNFRDLLLEVSKSTAMLRYLNNQQNTKKSPNENFARELLELFTLGVGNYTETDIKEAARALTGWDYNVDGKFIFRRKRHDNGDKVFMGERGNFKGEDIVDIILKNKQTAYFIANKVYSYFVNKEPIQKEVQYLADVFFESNYDIKRMMVALFNSDWFYNKRNIGTKIKSPLDLIIGVQKVIHTGYGANNNLLYFQRALGQVMFSPPNVAGWKRDLDWINNSTLLLRLKYTSLVLKRSTYEVELQDVQEGFNFSSNKKNRFKTLTTDLEELKTAIRQLKPNEREQFLRDMLMAIDISFESNSSRNPNQKLNLIETFLELTTLPEYQVC